jgi:hypothetical protein
MSKTNRQRSNICSQCHTMLLFILRLFLISSLCHAIRGDDRKHGSTNPKKKQLVVKGECLAVDDDLIEYVCMNIPRTRFPVYKCENTHPECDDWAGRGECTNNAQYMLLHCRQACHSCISLHHGETQSATEAARVQVLEKLIESQHYLHTLCDSSTVNHLKTCTNKHEMCAEWSLKGECASNPNYMRSECPLACQMC